VGFGATSGGIRQPIKRLEITQLGTYFAYELLPVNQLSKLWSANRYPTLDWTPMQKRDGGVFHHPFFAWECYIIDLIIQVIFDSIPQAE